MNPDFTFSSHIFGMLSDRCFEVVKGDFDAQEEQGGAGSSYCHVRRQWLYLKEGSECRLCAVESIPRDPLKSWVWLKMIKTATKQKATPPQTHTPVVTQVVSGICTEGILCSLSVHVGWPREDLKYDGQAGWPSQYFFFIRLFILCVVIGTCASLCVHICTYENRASTPQSSCV